MKKLFAAAPVLMIIGAWLVVPSCGNSDQGTGNGLGGSTGTGGSGTGSGTGGSAQGTGGSLGTGGNAPGTGGSLGTGGVGPGRPDGGTTTGTGGAITGTGGAIGGTGGAGALTDVAKPLDGQMLLGPCGRDTQAAVCATVTGACPPANTADRALSGVITSDKNVTIGGTAGTSYTITLHVQGEVESKQYPGGVDQNATNQSPRADGFCTGGTPTTADAYNVYMIRVTNPGATTHTDYFLNSLQLPGVSNHTTYGIDYTAQIKVQGGATLRLVAADSNCSMIKNCGPTVNDGNTCAAPIVLANVEPTGVSLNPTFNFTSAYNGQWIVLTVKNVTSP